MDELIKELWDSYFWFFSDLRDRNGFNENHYNKLCEVLKRCKKEWDGLNSLPRTAVCILIEIVPTINIYGQEEWYSVYNDREINKIREAVKQLNILILDAVETEELHDYFTNNENN